jgi:hypothetical protein
MLCPVCGHTLRHGYPIVHIKSISYTFGTGNAFIKAKELIARETMGRRKRLLAMLLLGLMLWPTVLCADAQVGLDASLLAAFNLQEKLSDQQLKQRTGHGCEKPKVCQDGKIVI